MTTQLPPVHARWGIVYVLLFPLSCMNLMNVLLCCEKNTYNSCLSIQRRLLWSLLNNSIIAHHIHLWDCNNSKTRGFLLHQRAAYCKLCDFINQVFAWKFFGTGWYFSNKSYNIKLKNLKDTPGIYQCIISSLLQKNLKT